MADEAAQPAPEPIQETDQDDRMSEAVVALTEAAESLKETLTNTRVGGDVQSELNKTQLDFMEETLERLRTIDENVARMAGQVRTL